MQPRGDSHTEVLPSKPHGGIIAGNALRFREPEGASPSLASLSLEAEVAAPRRAVPRALRARKTPEQGQPFRALHEIFEAQADRRPEAIAVAFDGQEITYAALEAKANRFARRLRAAGVRRGGRVALFLPRSVEAYAAILGILKAGAAYVPLDPEYPADRVAYILSDSGAEALVTSAHLAEKLAGFAGAIIRTDSDHAALESESPTRLPRDMVGVGLLDLCYVIYTSGSTGRPKGVMIEHRSACHLVCAEARIYGVRAEDRVYQGASLAFDISVEEIWMAFHAGATLVPATPQMAHAGPDLSRLLERNGVTALSCVPTLLSMLAEDVPTLRLIILGGETCPDQLVQRWARPGRRILNTYGPTETTVIATWTDVVPGKRVTIGRALPGYRVHVLDEALRPVSQGEPGEICVGGIGVARGYVGLPDQTRARFVRDPFAPEAEQEARIYRTGDMGRFDAEGELEFLGRADSQVKLRGFRVELAEIESVLMQDSHVRAAACAVRAEEPAAGQLIAYVVPSDGAIDEERLRDYLRERLPAYMVPALIETVRDLPRLPSGKLDRGALPPPRPRSAEPPPGAESPRTDTERAIAQVWAALFHPLPVGINDDFFHDLGGHSLLAARMVSQLRRDPRFARVAVMDVYDHPTIASLAAALERTFPQSQPLGTGAPNFSRRCDKCWSGAETPGAGVGTQGLGAARAGQWARHFAAGLAQTASLYFVFGFRALQWSTPYLIYFVLLENGYSIAASAAWAAMGAMAVFPLLVLVMVAAKWLVLGRVRAGRYPLWGWYYLRWWFVQALVSAVPLVYLAGTPVLPFIYRLLGARVGRDVHLGMENLAAFDLTAIGDYACVDDQVCLFGYTVEGDELVIGHVTIGRECFVGTRSVLQDNVVMEDGARLEELSLLPRGSRVPAGQTWAGSPAQCVLNPSNPAVPPRPERSPLVRAAIPLAYAMLVLIVPLVLLAAVVPGLAILMRLNPIAHPWRYLGAAPLVGGIFVLLVTLEVVLLKWLLVGRVRPGIYPVHGGFYIRNWLVDQLLALSLDFAAPLRATLYLAPWYRALGAKLGQWVELSTASSTTPDLLEIGDGGTVADEVSLGAARIEGGWMIAAPTRLGRRAFIGNSAVVPAGTDLEDGSLVGVLSLAPRQPDTQNSGLKTQNSPAERDKTQNSEPSTGQTWLGSPPRLLPRREPSSGFVEHRTYKPPRWLALIRGTFELMRITLPGAGFILVTATVVTAAIKLGHRFGPGVTLGVLPLVYGACCIAVILAIALAKWLIIGRYRPFVRPLWSLTLWRLELVNALYEFLATPLALEALQGTPLFPWYLRLLGARIGRRAYFHTTGLLEWDLVEVGDQAALNDDCVLQTHLFEDRVLKASPLRIGAGCAVGAVSVVLYDSEMEEGARLEALSLLMKGERLPAGTAWAGIPAKFQAPTSNPQRSAKFRTASSN